MRSTLHTRSQNIFWQKYQSPPLRTQLDWHESRRINLWNYFIESYHCWEERRQKDWSRSYYWSHKKLKLTCSREVNFTNSTRQVPLTSSFRLNYNADSKIPKRLSKWKRKSLLANENQRRCAQHPAPQWLDILKKKSSHSAKLKVQQKNPK